MKKIHQLYNILIHVYKVSKEIKNGEGQKGTVSLTANRVEKRIVLFIEAVFFRRGFN